MSSAAILIYWPIVGIWLTVIGTILYFYWHNPEAFGTTRLLLAVLAIDTLRNIVENIYFGLYFGAQHGFFPAILVGQLGQPILLILPKLLNAASGFFVLTILLLHWLPAAIRERQTTERTVEVFREMATHDGLTGLVNRSEFLSVGEREWERSHRYARPLSMLMLDIDLFKSINDRYGHDIGDRVIARIADICRDCTRSADIAARVGGEEFAVLLPETGLEEAIILAERLRQTVAQSKLGADGEPIATTVSIGVSQALGLDSFTALIKASNMALYQAKQAGRNRVCDFEACLSTQAASRSAIAT
jgi:diguanylate cyclase (GGDEF)-like protein